MEKVVADASVIVKWFVNDVYSENAIKLRDEFINEVEIVSTELMSYEVLNALKYTKLFKKDSFTILTRESFRYYKLQQCKNRAESKCLSYQNDNSHDHLVNRDSTCSNFFAFWIITLHKLIRSARFRDYERIRDYPIIGTIIWMIGSFEIDSSIQVVGSCIVLYGFILLLYNHYSEEITDTKAKS